MPPSNEPVPLQTVRWSGMTHRGHVRPNNEDSFLALTFDAIEVRYLGKTGEASLAGSDFVFAVSDGMGGAHSGEFASRIAVEKITRIMPRSFKLSAQRIDAGFSDFLAELIHAIHAEMMRLGQSYEECAGMGATLSLCWFRPGWMYFAHIGDSRIYYLSQGGGLTQITHDHTHVGWLRRQGKLNEREARNHPRRSGLSQSLGAGNQFLDPQFGTVGLLPGDRFLLCTDGLTDGLWDRNLEELLSEPQTDAERLVKAALENSGRDNSTALVVDVA